MIVRRLLDIGTIVLAALLGALLAGCGTGIGWNLVSPSSEIEAAVLEATSRHAATLGLNVRGQITDERCGEAAGWYDRGVAYFYRPYLATQATLGDEPCSDPEGRCERVGGLAAHEVCHAAQQRASRAYSHDVYHWCCMKNLGERPTFPFPVAIQGAPVCEPTSLAPVDGPGSAGVQ